MAPDGKMRETDCADTEGIFRIGSVRFVTEGGAVQAVVGESRV